MRFLLLAGIFPLGPLAFRELFAQGSQSFNLANSRSLDRSLRSNADLATESAKHGSLRNIHIPSEWWKASSWRGASKADKMPMKGLLKGKKTLVDMSMTELEAAARNSRTAFNKYERKLEGIEAAGHPPSMHEKSEKYESLKEKEWEKLIKLGKELNQRRHAEQAKSSRLISSRGLVQGVGAALFPDASILSLRRRSDGGEESSSTHLHRRGTEEEIDSLSRQLSGIEEQIRTKENEISYDERASSAVTSKHIPKRRDSESSNDGSITLTMTSSQFMELKQHTQNVDTLLGIYRDFAKTPPNSHKKSKMLSEISQAEQTSKDVARFLSGTHSHHLQTKSPPPKSERGKESFEPSETVLRSELTSKTQTKELLRSSDRREKESVKLEWPTSGGAHSDTPLAHPKNVWSSLPEKLERRSDSSQRSIDLATQPNKRTEEKLRERRASKPRSRENIVGRLHPRDMVKPIKALKSQSFGRNAKYFVPATSSPLSTAPSLLDKGSQFRNDPTQSTKAKANINSGKSKASYQANLQRFEEMSLENKNGPSQATRLNVLRKDMQNEHPAAARKMADAELAHRQRNSRKKKASLEAKKAADKARTREKAEKVPQPTKKDTATQTEPAEHKTVAQKKKMKEEMLAWDANDPVRQMQLGREQQTQKSSKGGWSLFGRAEPAGGDSQLRLHRRGTTAGDDFHDLPPDTSIEHRTLLEQHLKEQDFFKRPLFSLRPGRERDTAPFPETERNPENPSQPHAKKAAMMLSGTRKSVTENTIGKLHGHPEEVEKLNFQKLKPRSQDLEVPRSEISRMHSKGNSLNWIGRNVKRKPDKGEEERIAHIHRTHPELDGGESRGAGSKTSSPRSSSSPERTEVLMLPGMARKDASFKTTSPIAIPNSIRKEGAASPKTAMRKALRDIQKLKTGESPDLARSSLGSSLERQDSLKLEMLGLDRAAAGQERGWSPKHQRLDEAPFVAQRTTRPSTYGAFFRDNTAGREVRAPRPLENHYRRPGISRFSVRPNERSKPEPIEELRARIFGLEVKSLGGGAHVWQSSDHEGWSVSPPRTPTAQGTSEDPMYIPAIRRPTSPISVPSLGSGSGSEKSHSVGKEPAAEEPMSDYELAKKLQEEEDREAATQTAWAQGHPDRQHWGRQG